MSSDMQWSLQECDHGDRICDLSPLLSSHFTAVAAFFLSTVEPDTGQPHQDEQRPCRDRLGKVSPELGC